MCDIKEIKFSYINLMIDLFHIVIDIAFVNSLNKQQISFTLLELNIYNDEFSQNPIELLDSKVFFNLEGE